jgi:ribonuclease P protein subunit RPR2
MVKTKTEGGAKKVPNRQIFARISYLHQAAHYLSHQQFASQSQRVVQMSEENHPETAKYGKLDESEGSTMANGMVTFSSRADDATANLGVSRELASHIFAVSRKGVVKLSRELKSSICKRCNSVLVAGQTAESRVENKSRGGGKPWADVLVTTCVACGMQKRYPVGAQRQPKRKERTEKPEAAD